MKRKLIIIFMAICVLTLSGCTDYCDYGGCMEEAESGSRYCYWHKDSTGGEYTYQCPNCKRYKNSPGLCYDCIEDLY